MTRAGSDSSADQTLAEIEVDVEEEERSHKSYAGFWVETQHEAVLFGVRHFLQNADVRNFLDLQLKKKGKKLWQGATISEHKQQQFGEFYQKNLQLTIKVFIEI